MGIIFKGEQLKQVKYKVNLNNIKSIFIVKKILSHLIKNKSLKIIKYNKQLQRRLNLSINDYKEYSQLYSSIEIELKLDDSQKIYNRNFINIFGKEKDYYHIYFDNSNEEIKRNYLEENEKVNIIKIIIDYQVKSIKELFYDCKYISSIFFKKFYRNINDISFMFSRCYLLKEINLSNFNTENISDMKYMFDNCLSLKELNLSNFNTDNITNMSGMFNGCSSLKEINLSNFNTNNVTDMSNMFYGCSSLEKLNISNFNTNNVINMKYMFSECSSLKELNISNFNTNNVINMDSLFYQCSSLKELNLSNFNTNNVKDMSYMFSGCSSLKKLNLTNFNTYNVNLMSHMFNRCLSLKELKFNFNANKIDNMSGIFNGCPDDLKKKIKEQNKNIISYY